MKRTAFAVVVGTVVVGALTTTGCSISIGSMGQGSPPASVGPGAVTSPAAPASPSTKAAGASPSATAAGAAYLALVGPLNTTTFALDTAVLGSSSDLTTQSLSAVIVASKASIQTFDDHLRSASWPRTAEPDITTLAATNDVLVVLLQGYESDLRSPTQGADFGTVLRALQVEDSAYAIDRGLASDDSARVRSDLGLPPPSSPQVTLND
jgi:hypothetical protein